MAYVFILPLIHSKRKCFISNVITAYLNTLKNFFFHKIYKNKKNHFSISKKDIFSNCHLRQIEAYSCREKKKSCNLSKKSTYLAKLKCWEKMRTKLKNNFYKQFIVFLYNLSYCIISSSSSSSSSSSRNGSLILWKHNRKKDVLLWRGKAL